jgi:FtsP/CotA-like multicopper oxidase with cupredoxin domain
MKSVVLIICAFLLMSRYASAEERQFTLVASTTAWQVAPGRTVSAYTYNGTIPGPVLRGAVGDTFRVTLVNSLPVATTIHWHGLPVPNGMDGVPGLTSPIIRPGESFTYVFEVWAAGTYWYHPHADSSAQIARGLYGMLIVDQPLDAPAYDQEVLVIIGEHGTSGMMPGGMGAGLLLINGKTAPAIPDVHVRKGTRVLFRIVNTGNMVHPMHVHGLHWLIVATDGFALDSPYKKDTLPVNAGERFDGILLADNPGVWMIHCHNLEHLTDRPSGLVFNLIIE